MLGVLAIISSSYGTHLSNYTRTKNTSGQMIRQIVKTPAYLEMLRNDSCCRFLEDFAPYLESF